MGWALENLGSGECKLIAEGLFKVDRDYGGVKLHGFCPVHNDKNSASFVYHYGSDWCKCQSCGFGGDLVKLWAEVTGHDHQDIRSFKAEFGEGSDTYPQKTPHKTAPAAPKIEPLPDVFIDESVLDSLPPLPDARVQELIKSRGWSVQTIEKMDLREFVAGGRYKKIAIPVRDDDGRLCNIRLYQPGAKIAKIISWYDEKCHACGSKWTKVNKSKICSECQSVPIDYGRSRLLPSPSMWGSELLWFCEGESDLICALSHGLNAATQTTGARSWNDDFSIEFAGRDVVLPYDADKPGFDGAMKTAKLLAEHAKHVRVMIWPEWMGGAE